MRWRDTLLLAIDVQYDLLRESKLPILILADNKAVVEAAEKIKQGKYSASSHMNRFLTNINKIPITVKHLSGKYGLNTGADHQSRHPSSCQAQLCSIHKFIQDAASSALDPASKCAPLSLLPGGPPPIH